MPRNSKDELPGILNWALEGLDRLTKNGVFTRSRSSELSLERYKRDSNPVISFVEDCCALKETPTGCAKEFLFTEYKQYCETYGFTKVAGNKDWFIRELKRQFPSVRDVRPWAGDDKDRPRHLGGIVIVKLVYEMAKKPDSK